MNPVLESLQFRHACKQFDTDRKIPRNQLEEILECGRLSPSSFGLEPWRFMLIQNSELRYMLRKASWDQPQITDASDVIAITARSAVVRPQSEYVKQMFARRTFKTEMLVAYHERYKNHHEQEVDPYMNDYAWTSKQCYIALSNMMTAAAAVGIDSCPMEGFSKQQVEEVLSLTDSDFEITVLLALGYRAGEQTPRIRQDKEQTVSYL